MSDSSSNTSFRAKVQFEFRATQEGEINLKVGDVVVVTDNSDGDWWGGYIEGKPEKKGFFPANHVENQSDTVDDTVDDFIWKGLSRKLNSAMTKIDSMQIDLNDQKARIEELEGLPRMKKEKKVPAGMYLGGGRKHKRKSKIRKSKKGRKRTKRRKSSKRRKRR